MTNTNTNTKAPYKYEAKKFNLFGKEIETAICLTVKYLNKKTNKQEEKQFVDPQIELNGTHIILTSNGYKFETAVNNITLNSTEHFIMKCTTKEGKEFTKILAPVKRGKDTEPLDIQVMNAYKLYRSQKQDHTQK